MQEMGLEPTRYCYHRHLKPARLPIPPLLLDLFYLLDTIGILHYFYVEVKHILKFFLKNFTDRKIPFIPCKAEHLLHIHTIFFRIPNQIYCPWLRLPGKMQDRNTAVF